MKFAPKIYEWPILQKYINMQYINMPMYQISVNLEGIRSLHQICPKNMTDKNF